MVKSCQQLSLGRLKGELHYWLNGGRWETGGCETAQDLANLLLPPTTALRAEMVGLGRGRGLMIDLMIDAADRLIKKYKKYKRGVGSNWSSRKWSWRHEIMDVGSESACG